MSDVRDFVLDFLQVNGALVEPPSYGVHEVLLPDALAARLDVPALQEIVFDDGDGVEDGRLHLAQGHAVLERMVELARQMAAPTCAHINAVRLDKRGLAAVARQTLSFANARLQELPGEVERRALFHYLVLTFKVTLTTDEKREQLVTVALDAQAGRPVDWPAIREQATLEEEPAFGHLEPAKPRWLNAPHPLTSEALAGLLLRAEDAAVAQLSGPIEALNRRAARYLALDRARLQQYYDDLVHDLERRLRRAEGQRQATLQDKIAAAESERALKLADAEARYRLRIDLELITAQVVTQPKNELLVQIENRNTQVQRRIVWDPLLHTIEPLACDVCGQPGLSLHLCSGGHLAHAECLLEEQCADCKRVYCRLCGDEMVACAVCGRPVCRTSFNRCGVCGRGTCREHVGLCHAADGKPARPRPEQTPASAPAAPASPAAKPRPESRPAPRPAPRAKSPAGPSTANWKLEVEVEWSEPLVTAFVRAGRRRTLAVRSWRLTPVGISVACDCSKPDCQNGGLLLRPDQAEAIEAQLENEIQRLREEYDVSLRAVTYTVFITGMPSPEPRLVLRGQWKNEEVLAKARQGFDAEYARQYGAVPRPARERQASAEATPRPLQPHERAEAERFLRVAFGLLRREGTLQLAELYERVSAMLPVGDWCSPELIGDLMRENTLSFKVLANGLVAIPEVSNVQALAARKRSCRLPPHPWTAEELLALAESEGPLTAREQAIEDELCRLTGVEISVRLIQREFRRQVTAAAIVSALERQYGLSDKQAKQQAAALVKELSASTPRWELGGWTPAEAKA